MFIMDKSLLSVAGAAKAVMATKLKEEAELNARTTKISAYQKLGLTPDEIEALLPTPKPLIRQA